jgi:predicted RNA-binding Zn-ribbon protein involved in translation (DUF1610 family)
MGMDEQKSASAEWWTCPQCGQTCALWAAKTLPNYDVCPSCGHQTYVAGAIPPNADEPLTPEQLADGVAEIFAPEE